MGVSDSTKQTYAKKNQYWIEFTVLNPRNITEYNGEYFANYIKWLANSKQIRDVRGYHSALNYWLLENYKKSTKDFDGYKLI